MTVPTNGRSRRSPGVALTAGLLAVGLALAGCGGSSGPSGDGGGGGSSSPAAPAWDPVPGRPAAGSVGPDNTAMLDTVPVAAKVPAPADPAEQKRPDARMAFSGDMLIHELISKRALALGEAAGNPKGDFTSMLADVKPWIVGNDLSVCHLETVLAADPAKVSGYPNVRTSGTFADAMKGIGYDACSTASNHAMDFGTVGLNETLAEMDRAGLQTVGTARTQAEADEMRIYEVGPSRIKVGHGSYTYTLNGNPKIQPYAVNKLDFAAITERARALRAAGAEFVVMSLHWGEEYIQAPIPAQRTLAQQLADSGLVDLIIGSHAHVAQPITKIGGMWVAYGHGNFLSRQIPSPGREAVVDGYVLTVDVNRDGAGKPVVAAMNAVPTIVERDTWRVVPVGDALAGAVKTTETPASLVASWTRTASALVSLGTPPILTVQR